MQKKIIKYIMPVIIVIIGILWYLLSPGFGSEDTSGGIVIDLRQDDEGQMAVIETSRQDETSEQNITVHICGAVVNPGVYSFEGNVRVIQVIEAAGGACDNAMQDYLNLAQLVDDGARIYVPTKEEVLSGQVTEVLKSKDEQIININTATKEELMKLPGIGESKADSIIAYRKEYGRFKSTEEIMQIPGIKEALYDRIKDYIKV